MSKAFTKESDAPDVLQDLPLLLPEGSPNYMTPAGAGVLLNELKQLTEVARPEALGDESAEGLQRLAEIDRRLRFLTVRKALLQVVDPATQPHERVVFGSTVELRGEHDQLKRFQIVGIDEADPARALISWISPIAKVLLGKQVGDVVALGARGAQEDYEVLKIS